MFPFFRDLRSINVNVKGKDPLSPVLLFLREFFSTQTYRYLFKHVQITSKSKKKKILDRSHDEFQLPSLLYIDKTPQRSNPNNSSEHLKQLSSQTSPNCQLLITDRSFVLYDTSNSNTSTLQHLECSPCFSRLPLESSNPASTLETIP